MHDFNARSDAHDAQSAFAGRNLVRVARIGTHFYSLICPLGHQLYLKWELVGANGFKPAPTKR